MLRYAIATRLMNDIDFRIFRTPRGQKLVYPDMLTEINIINIDSGTLIDLFHRLSAQVRFARALRAANAKLPERLMCINV